MPGRISELPVLTTPAADDMIEVLDVSDLLMAPTGTNKKMSLGSTLFYGAQRVPFDEGVNGGLPGRLLYWGQSQTPTAAWVHVNPFVVSPGEVAHATRWRIHVETAQAGAKFNCAVYSVPNFVDGVTGTKVTGSEVVDIDCSTTGGKLVSLGATLTLPAGRYYCAYLAHGSSPAPTFWALHGQSGFNGANQSLGNGAAYDGCIVQVGASSLAATYAMQTWYAGSLSPIFIATLVP